MASQREFRSASHHLSLYRSIANQSTEEEGGALSRASRSKSRWLRGAFHVEHSRELTVAQKHIGFPQNHRASGPAVADLLPVAQVRRSEAMGLAESGPVLALGWLACARLSDDERPRSTAPPRVGPPEQDLLPIAEVVRPQCVSRGTLARSKLAQEHVERLRLPQNHARPAHRRRICSRLLRVICPSSCGLSERTTPATWRPSRSTALTVDTGDRLYRRLAALSVPAELEETFEPGWSPTPVAVFSWNVRVAVGPQCVSRGTRAS